MKANYRSILSDILGRDLLVSTEPEGSVLGAAAFAYHTLGMIDSFECLLERNPIIRKIRSEVNAHEFYQAQFDRYMHLYWKFQKKNFGHCQLMNKLILFIVDNRFLGSIT